MKYLNNSLLVLALGFLAFEGTLSSCGANRSKQGVDVSDSAATSMATDSVVFSESIDSVCECTIVADYPKGDDSLALGVNKFIAGTLFRQYVPVTEGDSEGAYKEYSGNANDGKAVVDYYGKGTIDYLKAQMADFRKAGMTDDISLACDISIRKTDDTPRYVTYKVNAYKFLGGAHGATCDYSVNISKPSGKVVAETVDTLKLKALQPLLRKGVLSYLEKYGDDPNVNDGNLNDCLFIENGVIPMPAFTPCLINDGVLFVYQQYEIGPYALGLVTFTVPYAEIKPFLTKEALGLLKE